MNIHIPLKKVFGENLRPAAKNRMFLFVRNEDKLSIRDRKYIDKGVKLYRERLGVGFLIGALGGGSASLVAASPLQRLSSKILITIGGTLLGAVGGTQIAAQRGGARVFIEATEHIAERLV